MSNLIARIGIDDKDVPTLRCRAELTLLIRRLHVTYL